MDSELKIGQEVELKSGIYSQGPIGKITEITPEYASVLFADGHLEKFRFDSEGRACDWTSTYENGPFYLEGIPERTA